MRHWLAANTQSRDETVVSTAWFSCFTMVSDSFYRAESFVSEQSAVIGHVSAGFRVEPLLRAIDSGAPTLPYLPEDELALAAWQPVERRLVLFRDPAGARALYFVHEPGRWVAFASIPEPLLAIPGVRDRVDKNALPGLLILGIEPERDATLFERLRRVPAGHQLTFQPDRVTADRFWSLNGRPQRRPDAEVPFKLRELLETAITRRIAGITHVAAHVSGGLDSSIVAALANRLRAPETALSLLNRREFDEQGEPIDPEEAGLAAALVEQLRGAQVHTIFHGPSSRPFVVTEAAAIGRSLPDLVFLLGDEERVFSLARSLGCQSLLTGWGGDEMASYRSNTFVLNMLAEGRWLAVARNLRRDHNVLRELRARILRPLRSRLTRTSRFTPAEREALLAPFRGRAIEQRVAAALRVKDRQPSLRAHRRELLNGATLQNAMELFDVLGQRHGICVRHPLQDRSVLEFCDQMPAEWIADGGEQRRALRYATRDLLPPGIVERRKTALVMPRANQRHRQRYQAWLRQSLVTLSQNDTWLNEYVDVAQLSRGFDLVDNPPETVTMLRPVVLAASALVVARATGTASTGGSKSS